MKVLDYILDKLKKERLHFTLIDPDPLKQDLDVITKKAKIATELGTDAIMVGGSTGFSTSDLDATIQSIKNSSHLPVILFPGNINGITDKADAIFFMSLLNSRNPYWITGAQVLGAPLVKRSGIEPISMGYLMIEPGGTVSFVGDAKPIPRDRTELVVAYALTAQYFGMSLVYLEAGSGVPEPVPVEFVKKVKQNIDIPLLVGGGMRSPKPVRERLEAGADIIVTGTIAEMSNDIEDMKKKLGAIIKTVKEFK